MGIRFFLKLALVGAMFFACGTGAASAACSSSMLDGTYGILSSGTDASGHPIVGVYLAAADGAGHLSGSGTENDNGVVTTTSFSDTYNIASGCTGKLKTPGGTIYLVVENGGAQIQFLNGGANIGARTGVGVKQGAVLCTKAGVQGAFGATGGSGSSGNVTQGTYNGKGHVSGTGTIDTNGTFLTLTSAGSYTIDSNCFVTTNASYSLTMLGTTNVVATGTTHGIGILVNGGSEILGISTDATNVGSTVALK